MVTMSRTFALLAAAAIAVPTAALANDPEQHVYVTGAMNDPEQHVYVTGAMTDPEQHVYVTGAMNDPEQHVYVTGAMTDPEQHVYVTGAMSDPEQHVTVSGAMNDPEQHVYVGAAKDRAAAPAAENPADRAIPELPVVYDEPAAPAPVAADVGSGTRGGKTAAPK